MRSASEILDEIRRLKGLKSDAALGDLLGVKQTTVASWRGRNSINHDAIIAFCVKEGLSFESLLAGNEKIIHLHGDIAVDPGEKYSHESKTDPQIEEMIAIMRDLDESSREDLLRQARKELKLQKLKVLEGVDQAKSALIDALEPRVAEQIEKVKEHLRANVGRRIMEQGSTTITKPKKVSG